MALKKRCWVHYYTVHAVEAVVVAASVAGCVVAVKTEAEPGAEAEPVAATWERAVGAFRLVELIVAAAVFG